MTSPSTPTIYAHGATVELTPTSAVILRSQLAASLGAPAREVVAFEDLQSVESTEPGPAAFGALRLVTPQETFTVRFAPRTGTTTPAADAASLIEAVRHGEVPTAGVAVEGLGFTVIDVETANDNWGSVCAIGAVRFRDGLEVESRSWLCTPPPGMENFSEFNIGIHGITPEDVKDAPSFATALGEMLEFLGDDVFVAHNVQFDSTALRVGAAAAGVELPAITLACSLALSRDASKAGRIDVPNHKLPTMAAAVGAPRFHHHDATEDARAAGLIITGLAQAFGYTGDIQGLFHTREFALGTLTNDAVMPVLRARTAPTSPADLGAGTDFRDQTRHRGATTPSDADETALFDLDGALPPAASAASHAAREKAEKRSRNRPAPWDAVATPNTVPEPNEDADPNGPLFGQHVTLTGDFDPFDKGTLWNGIAERGGQAAKSVTKKTTILVLGTWATKTSKEKKAEELIVKGQDIQLWPKDKLLAELGLDEEPPF